MLHGDILHRPLSVHYESSPASFCRIVGQARWASRRPGIDATIVQASGPGILFALQSPIFAGPMKVQKLLALSVLVFSISVLASPPDERSQELERIFRALGEAAPSHAPTADSGVRHGRAPEGSFLQTYLKLEFEGNLDSARERWITLFQNREERKKAIQKVEAILALSKRRSTPLEEARKMWDKAAQEIEKITVDIQQRLQGHKPLNQKELERLQDLVGACDCKIGDDGNCSEESKNELLRMKLMAFLLWDYEHTQSFKVEKQSGREMAASRFQAEFVENFASHLNPESSMLLRPSAYSSEYPEIAKAMLAASELFAEIKVQTPSRNAPAAIAGLESLNGLCNPLLAGPGRFQELAELMSSVHWTPENRILLMKYLLNGEVPVLPLCGFRSVRYKARTEAPGNVESFKATLRADRESPPTRL